MNSTAPRTQEAVNASFARSHRGIVLDRASICCECGDALRKGFGALRNVNTSSITCYDCAESITDAPSIY